MGWGRSASRIFGIVVAVLLGAASAVAGDRSPTVVELYTSLGCGSCPPADRYLGKLAEREDIIALSFHVNYWDYIGWKDTFALPESTARQRRHGRALNALCLHTRDGHRRSCRRGGLTEP